MTVIIDRYVKAKNLRVGDRIRAPRSPGGREYEECRYLTIMETDGKGVKIRYGPGYGGGYAGTTDRFPASKLWAPDTTWAVEQQNGRSPYEHRI